MERAAHLLLEDAAVLVTIGNSAIGTAAPVFDDGNEISIMGSLRSMTSTGTVQKTNTKGAGDARVKNRYHSSENTIEIEQFVPSTGLSYFDTATMQGRYIRIREAELSSMSSKREWIGVIEQWRHTGRVAGEQAENITVGCNPDFDGAP